MTRMRIDDPKDTESHRYSHVETRRTIQPVRRVRGQQFNTMESHSISRRHPQQIASECSRTAKPIESRAAPFVEHRLGCEEYSDAASLCRMVYSKYYIAGTNKPAGNPIHRLRAIASMPLLFDRRC
jgi:hypothetical protein